MYYQRRHRTEHYFLRRILLSLALETTADYTWLIDMLKKLYETLDIPDPVVIVTDAELGLIRSIPLVFTAQTRHLLCLWHINKNVMANCRNWFDTDEDWNAFNAI